MSSVRDSSDPKVAEHILRSYRTWAVVGCSSHPWRASHGVSRYLLSQGYDVVPINPNEALIHGRQAYPDLASARTDPRAPIEVVDDTDTVPNEMLDEEEDVEGGEENGDENGDDEGDTGDEE